MSMTALWSSSPLRADVAISGLFHGGLLAEKAEEHVLLPLLLTTVKVAVVVRYALGCSHQCALRQGIRDRLRVSLCLYVVYVSALFCSATHSPIKDR